MLFFELFALFAGLAAVIYSSGLLVRTLVVMARFLRISEYVLAFILMAVATSLPEFFVGISSAVMHKSLLSLGNLAGANVFDLTLVLGVSLVVAGFFHLTRAISKEDLRIIFTLVVVPALMLLDGKISRLDGFILFFLFLAYLTRLIFQDRRTPEVNHAVQEGIGFSDFMKSFFKFGIGVVLLLFGSWFVVFESVKVATGLGVSLFYIGLLVLALGTTLPEMAFGIKSVMMKHESMSLGNSLGSAVFNITGILGVTAMISPIIPENPAKALAAMFLAAALVFVISLAGFLFRSFSRRFGIFLLAVGALFILAEVFF